MSYIAGDKPIDTLVWTSAVLEWTTDPPTKPGLYRIFHENVKHIVSGGDWAAWEEIEERSVMIAAWTLPTSLFVVRNEDDSIVLRDYISSSTDAGFQVWWLGPLPEPEAPRVREVAGIRDVVLTVSDDQSFPDDAKGEK